MKKVILASLSNLLMIVIPLLGKPALMLDWKILLMIAGSIAMWLTQPPVSVQETNDKQNSDRFSVILILAMSALGVIAPIVDWAYFHETHNQFDWVTVLGIATLLFGIYFRAWAVNTLGKFCINQKIGMLPLTPYIAPKAEPFMAIPNSYHTGAKYGATPYTSSLVSGKMHKIISK